MSGPRPVSVSAQGELPGEQETPGVLRILVAGQHAGTIEHDGETWRASWHARPGTPITCTGHPTAAAALAAVLRSGLARSLSARRPSRVFWSDAASRLLARAYLDGDR